MSYENQGKIVVIFFKINLYKFVNIQERLYICFNNNEIINKQQKIRIMKLIITTKTNYEFELKISTKIELEKGGLYNKQTIEKKYFRVDSPFCNTWFESLNKLIEFFSNIYLYKKAICK